MHFHTFCIMYQTMRQRLDAKYLKKLKFFKPAATRSTREYDGSIISDLAYHRILNR